MKILIVDDHEYTREGIIRILSDVYQLEQVGLAGNFNDAMELFKSTHWDLLIVDVNLVGKSGLELIDAIRKTDPNVPILVLSMVPVSQYARRIFLAGATGYVSKSDSAEEFLRGVRLVLKGLRFISISVQQEIPLLFEELDKTKQTIELSERELAVLQRLLEGKTTKDIAQEYKISLSAVNSYKKRIFEKFGVSNVQGLLRYAYENKLIC